MKPPTQFELVEVLSALQKIPTQRADQLSELLIWETDPQPLRRFYDEALIYIVENTK